MVHCGPGAERLPSDATRCSMRTHLIHCSYHKCLTVYFGRVMRSVFSRCLPWSGGYRHYNSHLEDFYAGFSDYRIASVNNRALDLERLGRFRLSRFIRDPRDLVVSGYFYHRRGAEPWLRIEAPTEEDWYFANGRVPEGLKGTGLSFAAYLQSLPSEEGLLAELEFRAPHLESMARWPAKHPDVATWRYEDIVGREGAVFREVFEFYGLSAPRATPGPLVRGPLRARPPRGRPPRAEPGGGPVERALHAAGEGSLRQPVRRSDPAARLPL